MLLARVMCLFGLFCLPLVLGCGGDSGGPAKAVGSQDELSAYVDEHGDQTDLDAGDENVAE